MSVCVVSHLFVCAHEKEKKLIVFSLPLSPLWQRESAQKQSLLHHAVTTATGRRQHWKVEQGLKLERERERERERE